MTTKMGCASAQGENSREVARRAIEEAIAQVDGDKIALSLVFASPAYDHREVISEIRAVTGNAPLLGCSTAGEFSNHGIGHQSIVVTVVASPHWNVEIGYGQHVSKNRKMAVQNAIKQFQSSSKQGLSENLGRTLFLVTDGLSGGAEDLIDEVMLQTEMQYQLFGGAAADDTRFEKTFVFCNDEVIGEGFVCAEVLSQDPLGIDLSHGWGPSSAPMRVTKSDGLVLHELNGRPAWELYEEYIEGNRLNVSMEQTGAFLLNRILGIVSGSEHKLRVPLKMNSDGSLYCAAEVPQGAVVQIMESDDISTISSGGLALDRARKKLGERSVAGALVFECVATRLRLGEKFAQEVESMQSALGCSPMMGCNSYGQLARIYGQFSGMMDATALACVIPR